KYPPGHSLLLVPGAWFGAPAAIPILLNGLAGALLFALVRRVSEARVALLAWAFWLAAPGSFGYRATYLSEVSTTVLWLLACWALWRWNGDGRARDLMIVSASVGWCAITRPWTAVALAIPVGCVVLGKAARNRTWRQVGLAAALGCVILAVVPLWNAKTTGD